MLVIFYPIAYIWALATSAQPWKTLLWMVVSLAFTWCLLLTWAVIWGQEGNSEAGAAVAAYAFIPSFIIPAIVGVIHARKHRKPKKR